MEPLSNYTNQTATNMTEMLNVTETRTTMVLTEIALRYDIGITVVLAVLAGATSLCTTIGNFMVVVAFVMEKSIRQPGNYLIASLAVTDILIGSLSMPLYTQYLLRNTWILGHVSCDLWLSLDYTVCLVSQYTVFLITLDRFCSVKFPARYRNWRTKGKIKVMIAISWAVPALIFFTSIMGWPYMTHSERSDGYCYAMFSESKVFSVALIISYYWITLAVMLVLYAGIYMAARKLHLKAKKTKDRIKRMTQIQKTSEVDTSTNDGEKESFIERKVNNTTVNNNINTPDTSPSTNTPNGKTADAVSSKTSLISKKKDFNDSANTPVQQTKTNRDTRENTTKSFTLAVSSNGNSDNSQLLPNPDDKKLTIESPIWKPRGSIPNASIHWDAFTGKTHHALQNNLDVGGNDSLPESPKMTRGHRTARSTSSNNFDSCSETSDSDNKPKVLHQLTSLIANIAPQKKTLRQLSRHSSSSRKSKNENRARKALRTITFIMGAFVLCWTPYHVMALVDSLCAKEDGEPCVNNTLYEFTYWLCYMNSPLNPFCYALANRQFKKAFLKMLKGEYIRDWWKKR